SGKRHPGWRLRLEAQRAGARGELHPDAPGPLAAAIEPLTPRAAAAEPLARELVLDVVDLARRGVLHREGSVSEESGLELECRVGVEPETPQLRQAKDRAG